MAKHKMFTTHNDLPADKREKIVALLNQHLANTFDLSSQVKQAHWNVKGMNFIALHELFDKLHGNLEDQVDLIAERATALGGMALGTARMAASHSLLPEMPADACSGKELIAALVDRYAEQAKLVRQAIDTSGGFGDVDTQDLFTEISRDLDKDLWFLEAHIQEGL